MYETFESCAPCKAVHLGCGDLGKTTTVCIFNFKILSTTYRINGLPPGPISMPDISAIDAVLNYEKHKYIFFVADPYNRGYHLFARNLSEHNRNKKVYTRWLNSRGIYR